MNIMNKDRRNKIGIVWKLNLEQNQRLHTNYL